MRRKNKSVDWLFDAYGNVLKRPPESKKERKERKKKRKKNKFKYTVLEAEDGKE